MPPHIRLYNTEYHPKKGGIITHMQDVSAMLLAHGFHVDIMCDQGDVAPYANVPVMQIPTFVAHHAWQKILSPAYRVRHIVKHLPDDSSVNLHWPREPHYARAVLEKYGADQMVYIMATVYPRMLDFAKGWGFKNRLRSLVFRPQIARIEAEVVAACHVAVDSQARKDEVIAFYHADPDRVHVVPLGIDEQRFVGEKQVNQTLLTGLTVARLSPEKAVHRLLEALAQVTSKHWQWVIVGDGWMRAELEALSARLGLVKEVQFVGAVDAKAYYANADLFVLPSDYEGFGLVLLEAMVNRLPCIAFDSSLPDVITASREIIAHDKTGFIVEARNSKAMAARIDCLLNDADLRHEMGESGYQRSRTIFTWQRCVEGYLGIHGDALVDHV